MTATVRMGSALPHHIHLGSMEADAGPDSTGQIQPDARDTAAAFRATAACSLPSDSRLTLVKLRYILVNSRTLPPLVPRVGLVCASPGLPLGASVSPSRAEVIAWKISPEAARMKSLQTLAKVVRQCARLPRATALRRAPLRPRTRPL